MLVIIYRLFLRSRLIKLEYTDLGFGRVKEIIAYYILFYLCLCLMYYLNFETEKINRIRNGTEMENIFQTGNLVIN